MVVDVAAEAAAGEQPQYGHLRDRALAFIGERGGCVHEDLLIAHVFGAGSSLSLWRPLIQAIIGVNGPVQRRPDGFWYVPGPAQSTNTLTDFVVLDVETTGLKSRDHRVIEVALISISPGAEPLRWSSLVNPERSVPQYVASLTGLDNQAVAQSPLFRSIGPTIREIIGDRIVVGHNVEFDLGFLNAELRRADLPTLINARIDTLALSNALVPEARRLSLDAVTTALGVEKRRVHRAMSDAEMTLDVLGVLLQRAAEAGCHQIEDLMRASGGGRRPRRPTPPAVGRGRALLDRGHLADIPNAPGVYVMRDASERVIYVGKAKDLRKRVSSYYSQPLGYTRKMDGLLETLASIEVEVVGCELAALLLESQLIRRYRPRFNTAQRNVDRYVYIRLDTVNQWPTLTVATDRRPDGAVYFGPFRSSRQARDAVQLVHDILPLRTCKRSFRDARSHGSPCIQLSLKRCPGPCVGSADREQYRSWVNDILAFFQGDQERLLPLLHERLEACVAEQDFERAARVRDQIGRLGKLALEHVQLNSLVTSGHALLVVPGRRAFSRDVWYLLGGQRWAECAVDDADSLETIATRLELIRERAVLAEGDFLPDHESLDEMTILWRWIRKTPDHPALIPWEEHLTAEDVAERVRLVDLTQPFGETAPIDDDESAADQVLVVSGRTG